MTHDYVYNELMTRSTGTTITSILAKNSGFLLAMLGGESRRKFAEAIERFGISWQGLHVISFLPALTALGPVSQKRLADFTGVDPRNLVATIDALEEQGLVQRKPNPTDRRGYQLELTDKGADIQKKLRAIRSDIEASMFASLTEAERTTFHKLLEKLWEHSDLSQGFHMFSAAHHVDSSKKLKE